MKVRVNEEEKKVVKSEKCERSKLILIDEGRGKKKGVRY